MEFGAMAKPAVEIDSMVRKTRKRFLLLKDFRRAGTLVRKNKFTRAPIPKSRLTFPVEKN